jgi:hypothetical protein
MNVEELREIAEAVVDDVQSTDVVSLLNQLRTAVSRQVNEPANADLQTAVASARGALAERLRAGAVGEFNPRWRELLDEMGIAFLLPDRLLGDLDDAFLQNQVTPQVVNDAIAKLTDDVTAAVDHLQRLIDTLQFLSLGSSALGAGEFEASVLIPRGEVDNALGSLGREFEDLEILIRPFIEADSGSPPPLQVRQIASTDFLAVVYMTPGAALLLSKAIDGVLAVYERVLRIRKLRQELNEAGIRPETVDAIEQDATEMVEREIPGIVREVMEGAAALPSDGRRNEIEVAITKSVRGIAKRVDHGFRMTVRAGPPTDEEDGEPEDGGDGDGGAAATLAAIRELVIENQRRAEFHELVGEPILKELGGGESDG